MIILIEGPRNVGKTHLIKSFFDQNTNPDILQYKYDFAGTIQKYNIANEEAIHYFSIANILTVFDMIKMFPDKTWILDRSLLSAYVWGHIRHRLPLHKLAFELFEILDEPFYANCHVIYVDRYSADEPVVIRSKDQFDKFENHTTESDLFDDIIDNMHPRLIREDRNNAVHRIFNNYDQESELRFNTLLNELIDK